MHQAEKSMHALNNVIIHQIEVINDLNELYGPRMVGM